MDILKAYSNYKEYCYRTGLHSDKIMSYPEFINWINLKVEEEFNV